MMPCGVADHCDFEDTLCFLLHRTRVLTEFYAIFSLDSSLSQHDIRVTANTGVLHYGCQAFHQCATCTVLCLQFDFTVCDVWNVSLTAISFNLSCDMCSST
jgi:hypothetical protein